MALKRADQVCRYRDRSSTLRGLRILEVPPSTLAVEQHCSQDRDCTITRVDILPLQTEVFFRTHPGPKSDPEYKTVFIFGGGDQEPLCFLKRERFHLRLESLGQLYVVGRVESDKPPLDGLF